MYMYTIQYIYSEMCEYRKHSWNQVNLAIAHRQGETDHNNTSKLQLPVPAPNYVTLLYVPYQWRIQLWADRAAAPLPSPIDQNLGLVMAARVRHGGKISLKSLTFGHFLYKNVQKSFQHPPWPPTRGSAPGPLFRNKITINCQEFAIVLETIYC